MKNIYNNLLRSTTLIGLSAITLIGCNADREIHELNSPIVEESNKLYFDKWGLLEKSTSTYKTMAHTHFKDLDGDGDLDIITINKEAGIRIYENKIPQKIK